MSDLAFLKAYSCVLYHKNAMPSFVSILSGWISALRFCAVWREVVCHSYEPQQACLVSGSRHLCDCGHLIRVRSHPIVCDYVSHELDFT